MVERNDIIGRPLMVGDHVGFYNNIYKIVEFKGKQDAVIFLAKPSATTHNKRCRCSDLILLPEQDIIMWLLKKPA